jgi:hypothetical protein
VRIVELHGTMRDRITTPDDEDKVVEREHQADLAAIVPTKTFPYRIAMHGPEVLVERARDEFVHFVDSVRVVDEQPGESSASGVSPGSSR